MFGQHSSFDFCKLLSLISLLLACFWFWFWCAPSLFLRLSCSWMSSHRIHIHFSVNQSPFFGSGNMHGSVLPLSPSSCVLRAHGKQSFFSKQCLFSFTFQFIIILHFLYSLCICFCICVFNVGALVFVVLKACYECLLISDCDFIYSISMWYRYL